MPPNSRPNRTMLRRALFLLAACGIAAFAVLMLQLFRLQILRHDELECAALQQQLRRTAAGKTGIIQQVQLLHFCHGGGSAVGVKAAA